MQHYLLTKENAEVILNKARRLRWDDANEIMAIMRDLKPVRITDGEEKSPEEKADFTNKFSGTGDRNESKERSEANDKSNPNVGGPVY